MKREAVAACLILGCSRRAPDVAAHQPLSPSSTVSAEEPPPHLHAYPEIPPDELASDPAPDGGAELGGPGACSALPAPPPIPWSPPRIASGPPLTNHIPPEVVMRPMRARVTCFQRCYARALAKDPSLHGRVVVRFVIDRDGFVRKSSVAESTMADPSVGRCVAQELVGMQFATHEGVAVTVLYPLVFEPQ